MKITYIGHATLLLELDGRRILTDPNFDPTLGRFLPRVSAPGIALEALPKLDALLLTHAHADHLSFRSLARLPRDVPLYAPPAVARWLERTGYRNAVPIAPGGEATVGGITVRAASARHVGSRYGFDRWRGAANMYLVETPARTIFFAGDTALTPDTHRVVADRLHAASRTLDVALLPIGHAPWWKPGFRRGHLTSADALTLFERLEARYFVPYHWGTFNHVTSTAHDAITRLRALLSSHHRAADVRILEPGEALEVEE
ncbi:MAG TPA: MBL fold metallo-hydrolase [Gemmatimonadaceae bacterium]|nr:MBL fold metallo-hydrolase [Gemmatimonadaceae bacterium]